MHDWLGESGCRDKDPEDFFMGHGRAGYAEQRKVCFTCPVMELCLWFCMSREDSVHKFGFFGGMSPEERASLRIDKWKASQFYERELEFWNSSRSIPVRQLVGHGS